MLIFYKIMIATLACSRIYLNIYANGWKKFPTFIKFIQFKFCVIFFLIFDLNKHLNRRFRNHTEEKNSVRAAKKSKAAANRMFSLPKNEVPSHMKGGPVVKHHMHNFDDFGREKYRSERKTERSWKIEKKS